MRYCKHFNSVSPKQKFLIFDEAPSAIFWAIIPWCHIWASHGGRPTGRRLSERLPSLGNVHLGFLHVLPWRGSSPALGLSDLRVSYVPQFTQSSPGSPLGCFQVSAIIHKLLSIPRQVSARTHVLGSCR